MISSYFLLFLAILSETVGTVSLRASEGFSKPLPSVLVVVGYAVAFYLVSLTLKEIPLGITYAIWSGVGLVATAVISYFVFSEQFNTGKIVGLVLILLGVVVLNFFNQGAKA